MEARLALGDQVLAKALGYTAREAEMIAARTALQTVYDHLLCVPCGFLLRWLTLSAPRSGSSWSAMTRCLSCYKSRPRLALPPPLCDPPFRQRPLLIRATAGLHSFRGERAASGG